MSDLSIGIIETVTNNRPELVFLPPALLGYIAYLQQSLLLFVLTIIVIVISAGTHDIAEVIKREEQYKADNLQEKAHPVTQIFIFITIILFPIAAVATLIYAIMLFYQTFDLYVGIGISLYIIWFVKFVSPMKKHHINE